MFDWIADKLFGNLVATLITWSPWIWLLACAAASAWLLLALPLVFKRWWQTIALVAAIGFAGLWFWQNGVGHERKNEEIAELKQSLEDEKQRGDNLQGSIEDQAEAISRIEAGQRRISKDIAAARRGMDSGSIMKEATNDPAKAATDMSARWNALGRMSDDATGSFGEAKASSAGSGTDADAGSSVGRPQGG